MTIIITDDDVRRLLPMPDCIEAMHVAFSDFSEGSAVNRPRVRYLARHSNPELRYMANVHVGAVPSYGIACVRAGSQIMRPRSATNDRRIFENPGRFNWGVVILYSLETAEPVAFMHEFQLSGIRVGATTGMAVRQISRPNATRLGLFGTGKQAHSILEAILAVRPIREVSVYSPTAAHVSAFIKDMERQGLQIVAAENPAAVVKGADIVCCATNATAPLFNGADLEDGQFLISIANSDVTNKRTEVDRQCYERTYAMVVNDWESVIENDQTEVLDPIKDGLISRDDIHELGDVVTGKAKVIQTQRDAGQKGIIHYKNNSGLAIQFAAAGGLIYQKAMKEGRCREIPTEWFGTDLSSYYEAGFRPSP